MEKNEIRYIISDYCSRNEIEITEEQLSDAVEYITEQYAAAEEYNYRCGIYFVNTNLLLDNYFSDFE